MALDAKKIKSSGKKFVEQPNLEVANYPARVVQILDLGLQDGGEWKGEKKPPVNKIHVTYELVDAFMVDEDGKDIEDKPRWLSEDLNMFSPDQDKAKCNQRYLALDPEEVHNYDWAQLLSAPCSVLVSQKKSKGKVYDNVGLVTPYVVSRRNPELPPLVNGPKVFNLGEPELDIFLSLPTWLQDKIKGNLEFRGSALEKLLKGDEGGESQEPQEDEEPQEDDDLDWEE